MDVLDELEVVAREAIPRSCPSSHIDPDNPVWGPRLQAFRDACPPETVLKLVTAARAATVMVAPFSVPPLSECHCMECPCECWLYDLEKRRKALKGALMALEDS